MNASEPVMDAVEKVARAVFALDTGHSENYEWFANQYMHIAEGLIAAFPQLALEGREEFGYQFRDYAVTPTLSREHAVAFNEDRDDLGDELRAVGRTVWESPWSEVQS